MSRSILKDVTVDEMLKMRQSGMTNADIAAALECSYQTVRKYIGRQPGSLYGKSQTPTVGGSVQVPATPKEPPVNGPEAALVVEDRSVSLTGLTGSYIIPFSEQVIHITTDFAPGELSIPFSALDDFVKELSAIRRKLDEFKIRNEMW